MYKNLYVTVYRLYSYVCKIKVDFFSRMNARGLCYKIAFYFSMGKLLTLLWKMFSHLYCIKFVLSYPFWLCLKPVTHYSVYFCLIKIFFVVSKPLLFVSKLNRPITRLVSCVRQYCWLLTSCRKQVSPSSLISLATELFIQKPFQKT